jgi:ring-1,2-phenylacetyl-CoA epoxidase subunit PaaC
MKRELQEVLAARLLAMADDEFILGHRDSEWCGHAPILEEDIAFANIALDEIGHAIVWYKVLADLRGEDQENCPDQLVYCRSTSEFWCAQIVEQPKGDWAFTILRQYLFDAQEKLRLDQLIGSHYAPIANAAAKMRPEEIYHLRHSSAWVRRLGLGTEESNCRMQTALNSLWPQADQLFEALPDEEMLVEAGFFPDLHKLKIDWLALVSDLLESSGLSIPLENIVSLSRNEHSAYLGLLLDELQELTKLYPDANW